MKWLIFLLFITNIFCQIPDYDRKKFKHWNDEDRDCQSARQEVLIRDNLNEILFYKSEKECIAQIGVWYDFFSDSVFIDASDLDVDHIVPLKEAWISGAWKWSDEKREKYANFLGDRWHLMAVWKKQNRSKGAKPPHKWMPRNKSFHVAYCILWVRIKVKWGLTVTQDELTFLKRILKDRKGIKYPKVR